ncbi:MULTISPECIES: DoxX family membrane protein [unclassified Polaribacter]|uniref:DoxX family protein n=1 Tax=unclassified Polaribacter TaxID=196858 RepID=UPI0011BF559D|nr:MULTISPECIES: DoxX family membrane protein [unclassified Polaribacter]TXD53322.1 DoxX family membrane protein [Polaribacter sp. IC063]TXD57171.1 DoxX family membrane protein [Polaribacter sp. IC066]
MAISTLILKFVYGSIFCFAGIMHIIKPQMFKHFIPDFFPKKLVNYIVGFIELGLGFGLFFNQTTTYASFGIFVLLILLLPIHIWDVTKKRPAIGPKKIAIIRIPLQFVFMYGIYIVYLKS